LFVPLGYGAVGDSVDERIPIEILEDKGSEPEVDRPTVGVMYVTDSPVSSGPVVDVLLEVG